MFLDELNESKSSIEVLSNGKSLKIDAEILRIVDKNDFEYLKKLGIKHYCILKEIKYKDGKPLGFGNVLTNFFVLIDNKMYIWKDVKILRARLPFMGNVHIVIAKDEGEIFNRRENFRVFIGLDGKMKLKDRPKMKEVFIKDVSATGVGLVSDSSLVCNVGDDVVVYFTDYIMDKTIGREKEVRLTLNAKIVRINPINEKDTLIGCVLDHESSEMNKYVYTKQMIKRQLNH